VGSNGEAHFFDRRNVLPPDDDRDSITTANTTAAAISRGQAVPQREQQQQQRQQREQQQLLCALRQRYLDEAYDLPKLTARIDAAAASAAASATTGSSRRNDSSSTTATTRVYSVDKSPTYLRTPGVARTVRAMFGGGESGNDTDDDGGIKIVAILRDPVQRCYSQYLMVQRYRSKEEDDDEADDNSSFDMHVQSMLRRLRNSGLSKAPLLLVKKNVATATNASSLVLATPQQQQQKIQQEVLVRRDLATIPPELFLPIGTFEERARIVSEKNRLGRANGLYIGMYAQQISEWLRYFEPNRSIKIVQYERLQADRPAVFREMIEFLGLRADKVRPSAFETSAFRRQETLENEGQKLHAETEAYLKRFFKPYNDELADLLGEEWRGIWD